MIELKNISIQFDKEIIKDGHFIAHHGFVTGIMGISGSGKSSLLDIVSLLNYHGQFDYFFDGTNLKDLSQSQRALIQRTKIAYLRQKSVFLNTMNCLDNVRLESEISGHRISEKEALALLDKVHLKKKANVYPSKLSGGEEQRLAIAMALAKQADIIICDEITSMLDEENTNEIIQMLSDLAHHENKTVIIATHEQEVKHYMDQLYIIEDQTLKLVKQITATDQVDQKQLITKTNKKYMWQVAFSQITKRKINYLLMMIITSLTVSFLWYSKAISDENKTFWADRLDSISQNDFFIYNNPEGDYMIPDDMLSSFYRDYFLPFSDNIGQKIANLKNVKSIYPIVGAMMIDQDTIGSSRNYVSYIKKVFLEVNYLRDSLIVLILAFLWMMIPSAISLWIFQRDDISQALRND